MPVYITEFGPSPVVEAVTGSEQAVARSHKSGAECSESLFDIDRAAEYIGMSAKWLYSHYADLPHVRIGYGTKPRIKFRRCDLDAWVRKHRIE